MNFKELFNWLKKRMFKQFYIDNGEIGGVILNVKQSMFIFSIVNSVMLFGNAYSLYLHEYVSFMVGMSILVMCGFGLVYFYYMFIHPSQVQYTNRQKYQHGNYFRRDLENMDERTKKMEEKLNILYKHKSMENDCK